MVSVDFQPLETLMQKGEWTECGERLADAARKTEKTGAVIEGCTEISMLVNQNHTTVPLFDTTALHVEQAVCLALAE